jgi:hypothetical protein
MARNRVGSGTGCAVVDHTVLMLTRVAQQLTRLGINL